ncbi:TIM-barrel domain-containing protein [Microbacterium sp. ASV81]|uniref:Glycoside hydrolase family 31 protein n=1 Tax=Microbacterium capsulatum TaxID=3041921 RepID=A0ABU0XCP0_9MICO|nr:TIM-barrel domain-containing protein [Microbacterium sp. ASV81]MDQ4212873.1 glycoside hydrolase family 31 protein [Microbacterium sp. ASV81]
MIRHRPHGSGHPYSVDTEQRSPVVPEVGQHVVLGVRADARAIAVRCDLEFRPDGGETDVQEIPLARVAQTSRGRTVDGGHLASAAGRLARSQGGWSVRIDDLRDGGAYRYRFVASREDGSEERTAWHEFCAARWIAAPDALVVHGASRLTADVAEVLHDGERAWRVRFGLRLEEGERVAGFGERYDRIDQRGTELDAVVFEQYKSQGAERKTYLPMPFAHVVGGSGWGFHVDTTRRTWYDVGATPEGVLAVEAEIGPDGRIVVRFFDGDPTAVLGAFLDGVGRATELPDWVFRLWASGNEWNTQAEVMRQMNLHREYGIPVGSVVIEAWSDERTFTAFRDARYEITEDGAPHRLADFTFPADGAWPDPKGMADELHARDIRLHLWQIPLIKMRPHPQGQLAADARGAIEADVLIREPDPRGRLRPYRNRGWWFPLSLMPDLTDPRAAAWWTEKRRYLVEEVGVDGFKTDGGEHAWGRELVYLDGRRGDEKNNTFPVAYAKAYGDLLESAGRAPVTFSRAGFTGSQAHGAFWAGDENSTWEAFRWSMIAGLNAAASGIVYWGWDIAGFSGEIPDAELYIRAMQASVFVPIMQYHSEFNHHRSPSRDRTPWNIAERTGDDRVLPLVRAAVELREKLVPYLSVAAREAVRTDRPLMRPLFFDAPQNAEVWDAPLSWLLGDDILVVPVLEPGVEKIDLLLPVGSWLEVRTGTVHTGGGRVSVETPIESIPVFVREGATVSEALR